MTTPSLFTDSPTYEDMMLLSALLGPAKPPVASEGDVAEAGGLFKVEATRPEPTATETLEAVAVDGSARIPLSADQRCLVCLCDFEIQEEARRLAKCGHLFHRECIDEVRNPQGWQRLTTTHDTDHSLQWLTKGRNSCPLCRAEGVVETEKTTESASASGDNQPSTTTDTPGLVH